jgi:hypothetical protein
MAGCKVALEGDNCNLMENDFVYVDERCKIVFPKLVAACAGLVPLLNIIFVIVYEIMNTRLR